MVFAPGCALMLYKPELATKIHQLLNENLGEMDMLMTCCQHDPHLQSYSKIINVCPGVTSGSEMTTRMFQQFHYGKF